MTTTQPVEAPTPQYNDLPALLAMLNGDEKHDSSAASTLDVLWVLFDRVLRLNPADPHDPLRDRLYLSKGHGPHAYYAMLAAFGFLAPETLATFATFESPLGHHPDRLLVTGAEISSGSLGHGLPLALGSSLALRAQGMHSPRIVVLLGDAELDEGSNDEAIALAGRLRLDRLTAAVIDNRSASHGRRGRLAERFAMDGWATVTVSGRDHDQLESAFGHETNGRPLLVVAENDEP